MITIRTEDKPDPRTWADLVEACQGNALHYPQVHFLEHEPEDFSHFLFERNGNVVACGIAFSDSRQFLGFTLGSRALRFPTVPAIRDSVDAPEVYESLVRHARETGFSRLIIQSRWGDCFDGDPLLGGALSQRSLDFVIDLRQQFEEIESSMHKTHRKNIRRAQRTGMEVVVDDSLDGLRLLHEMQGVASERATSKGHGFHVTFDPQKAHANVYSKGIGQILFAKLDSEFVAGLAYLVGGKRAITVRSGSTAKGYETRAMYLLYHELIRRSREWGCVELNLGAVPFSAQNPGDPSQGLFEFKKGFGGSQMTRTSVDLIL